MSSNSAIKTYKGATTVIVSLMVILAMAFMFAGCSFEPERSATEGDANENNALERAASTSGSAAEPTTEDGSSDLGKTLVVYYSASGSTERVAREIAAATEGDLFAIEPMDPYTSEDLDYNALTSRVTREHDDESLREVPLVQTTPDGFDGYDTVFIGYPIWWGIAAWPVDGFVTDNDFNSKTVIPFCTSASSSLGDSADLLAEMANGGDWLNGMRFQSNASTSEIRSWLNELAWN